MNELHLECERPFVALINKKDEEEELGNTSE